MAWTTLQNALAARTRESREAAGLDVAQLAERSGLTSDEILGIEAGQARVDTLQIACLSSALDRSIGWLMSTPDPAIVSRRSPTPQRARLEVDARLEQAVRDVRLLVQLGHLASESTKRPEFVLDGVGAAEQMAQQVRRLTDHGDGPLLPLAEFTEALGLYAFVEPFPESTPEQVAVSGCYLELGDPPGLGVALVNGGDSSGRRRFTLAHELGHHLLADEYSQELDPGVGHERRETWIDAFAIHLLLPRVAIEARRPPPAAPLSTWRRVILELSADYGVSWTAACAHVTNLGFMTQRQHDDISVDHPRRADYLEFGLKIQEDLAPRTIPPKYAAAVVRAYRALDISAARAIELSRGTLDDDGLPVLPSPPLAALLAR